MSPFFEFLFKMCRGEQEKEENEWGLKNITNQSTSERDNRIKVKFKYIYQKSGEIGNENDFNVKTIENVICTSSTMISDIKYSPRSKKSFDNLCQDNYMSININPVKRTFQIVHLEKDIHSSLTVEHPLKQCFTYNGQCNKEKYSFEKRDLFSCDHCEQIYKHNITNNIPLEPIRCTFCRNVMNKNSLKFYMKKYNNIKQLQETTISNDEDKNKIIPTQISDIHLQSFQESSKISNNSKPSCTYLKAQEGTKPNWRKNQSSDMTSNLIKLKSATKTNKTPSPTRKKGTTHLEFFRERTKVYDNIIRQQNFKNVETNKYKRNLKSNQNKNIVSNLMTNKIV